MSTLGDLNINARITISEETADRCIQLLNIYLRDNPRASIKSITAFDPDGKPFNSITFDFSKRKENQNDY